MKKIAILSLICLLTAVLLFAGCDLLNEPFPEETEIDSSILIDPEKTQPETEAPLTPEEEALVELAAEALWAKHDLPAREHFKVSIHPHADNGSNRVQFTLRIGDYSTNESYNVRVSAEGEVTDIDGGYHNYRQFINGATPERIAAAEAGLDGQIARYGDKHSGYYLAIDKEGYLCLTCEVIVDKAFGDHEHKFFTERICKAD